GDDHESDETALNASFVGNVSAGGNATVRATQNGSAVENATVSVDGSVVARTDANGTATVPVSADAEELEVTVRSGDREVELSRELATDEAEDAGDDAEDAASDTPLNVTLDDAISEDGEATVVVTRDGTPVANATVEVDGDVVGHTGTDGRFPVSVSADGSLNVTVRADGDVATLERDAA
ncbi:MAG: dehydrogenase, partial [Haloferacaceae archaeon]